MTFGRRADPTSSGSTGVAASWSQNSSGVEGAAGAAARFGGMFTAAGALAFLRENARRILALGVAIFALGAVVLLMIPVRFAATALVVVDPREQRVTTEQDVLPGIGQDSAALQSLVEVAKSDGFLEPLIEQLKIRDDEDISGGYTAPARLLERFRNRLDISRRGLTYVIAIRFTSNRPERAAYYANAIAEAFVARQSRIRTEATDEAADWLGGRLKTLSDRLKASEDAVATFKLEHRIVNAGKDATTQQLRVTELSQQVAAARARTEEAKARYEQAQRDVKANVEGPVKQDLLSALRAQRSALNDQIAQKRAVLGDRHPDLVMSYSQLNDLNRQIEVERTKGIDTAKSEYEAQRDQQKALESQMKAAESQLLVDGQALVRLQELQRDAEANRNIYEQFLSRSKTTNEQRLLQSSQTKVASPAIPPLRSTLPPLSLLLAALAIGSLLTSTAVVAATGRRSNKPVPDVRAPEPAPRQPGAWSRPPVWARVPELLPSDVPRNIWQGPVSATRELDLGPHLRPLIDRLEQLPGSRGRVALVMSVGKRAGGNTVARSLNRWALNRGKLSVLIRVEPDLGGAGATLAKAPVDGATTADFRSIEALLNVGNGPESSPADDIRSEFDLIVIHATSLALQPEAAALAAHADLVILVVREDAIDSAAMRRATAALSRFGGVPTGIVVNRVPADPSSAQRRGAALGLAG
ncbi:GumC family protein [Bradyrhizobium sp. 147]|uniref:GumC family protein n=1 Tax=unclassified Bradyrhizobium TaxID=2631580 RepID=UPI001FF8D431|nr:MULTISPECIES: GumC family protein [unclassified Bradyrhizobium]MCK1546577.1 GumC family protein [Bradyrhizobium sp. 179]MCK1624308.1 GumC family protein [Bradyrhizobium sp. 160]MCK1679888.1 GumC family protein [Bradyrhizobium sp. 147]